MTHVKALQAGHFSQGTSEPITPALPPKPVPTELERLLQHLLVLQGIPAPALRALPGPIRRDWATGVCFSNGKAGHRVGW